MAQYRGSPLAMCVNVVSDHSATNDNNMKQIDAKTQSLEKVTKSQSTKT
jgi:hypothetical protein